MSQQKESRDQKNSKKWLNYIDFTEPLLLYLLRSKKIIFTISSDTYLVIIAITFGHSISKN